MNKIRILAVDDKREDLGSLQALLESPSREVLTAICGTDALRLLLADSNLRLMQQAEQLAGFKGEAEKAKEEAERTSLAKSRYLAYLSHELPNPLKESCTDELSSNGGWSAP